MTTIPVPTKQRGITAIILTFNEEKHIERCIRSLLPVVQRICVIDSFSTDRTTEIAKALGAEVHVNPWKNHAAQFQWALDNVGITSEWTLRIDSDEYLEPELQRSIKDFADNPGDVNTVYLRRKICFLGRPITHGFFYPLNILRLWKTGQGRMEQRWMDEHIVVENPVERTLSGDLVDDNLNDLGWWTEKHMKYARLECYELIAARAREHQSELENLSGTARRKRFLKEKVYGRLPSATRSSLYFLYRYIFGAGFLDGKEGFYFHFLQAYWYRTYVDATMLEIERKARERGLSVDEMLKQDGILQ